MAKENKERKIGKKETEKPVPEWLAYYRKHKSWIQGVVFGIVVIFFLILNNTRTEPESGNLPPGITPDSVKNLLKNEVPAKDTLVKDSTVKK